MFLHNRLHEVIVEAYNESVERATGGITQKTKGTSINLYVLWLPPKARFNYKDQGTYISETVNIQVSCKELQDKSFTITVGNTHIVKDGNDYRVVGQYDASYMNIQLKQYTLIRKIPKRGLD